MTESLYESMIPMNLPMLSFVAASRDSESWSGIRGKNSNRVFQSALRVIETTQKLENLPSLRFYEETPPTPRKKRLPTMATKRIFA